MEEKGQELRLAGLTIGDQSDRQRQQYYGGQSFGWNFVNRYNIGQSFYKQGVWSSKAYSTASEREAYSIHDMIVRK